MAGVAARFESLHAQARWRAIIRLGKRWFFRVPQEIAYTVWHHGSRTHLTYGKSIPRQVLDIIRLYLRNGLGAEDYYRGGLAGLDRDLQEQMVPYWMYRSAMLFCMKKEKSHASVQRLRSKSLLVEDVRAAGYNAPRALAVFDPNGPEAEQLRQAIDQSFFVKPDTGSKGHHAERWVLQNEAFYLADQNITVPKHEIASYLHNRCLEIGCTLLAQELIENSKAMQAWAGNALATARIVTCRSYGGSITIPRAMLRIPANKTISVDNVAQGGMGFHIETDTGTLALGHKDSGFGSADFSRNSPVTGVELTGLVIPDWDVAASTVVHLHEVLSDVPIIGWDVGFSPDGPAIVEANVPTGMKIDDQVKMGGFFSSPLGAFLAECIAQRLEETQPRGSRLMVGADRKNDV